MNSLTRNLFVFILGIVIGLLSIYYIPSLSKQNLQLEKHSNNMQMSHGSMSMEDQMSSMNANLVGKTGDDLDKAFLKGMIEHHNGAIEMAKTLKAGTKRPELQKFADQIIQAQAPEVEQMKIWLKQWFNL